MWGWERETWRKILRGRLDLASVSPKSPTSLLSPAQARTQPQIYWSSPCSVHLTAKPAKQAAWAILPLFPVDPGAGTSSIFPQYHSSQRGLWRVGGWFGLFFLCDILVPPPGMNPYPLQWKKGVLTGLPRKSSPLPTLFIFFFNLCEYF